jgi:uncharacterized membrane protein
MDISRLSHGAKLVLGAAVALFIVSWFDWFEVEGLGGFENMWSGIGVLAGLLLIALIVWQGIRLANINLEVGVTPSMVTAALAVLTLVFVFIRFIDKPGSGVVSDAVDRTFWAWVGLALAIALVVGAWMNMQAAGEGLTEMRKSIAGATAGATAAARDAVDRDDKPVDTPSTSSAAETAERVADDVTEGGEPPKPA